LTATKIIEQAGLAHRRSRATLAGSAKVHRDDRLAGHGEAPAAGGANGHIRIIGISNFNKSYEFFETFGPLS
jgi:hypothetical protein